MPKRLFTSLILVVFSILVALALSELAFRVYFLTTDSESDQAGVPDYIQLLPESGRGYGLKPLLGPPISTNSHGFRGKEFSIDKAHNVYRIIMLGDSITFGNSITWDKTFSALLEELLNSGDHSRDFEVINLGISGYNTEQELATLVEVGIPLKPDLILLNVCLNDSDPVKAASTAGMKNTVSITRLSDLNIRTFIASSYVLTFLKAKFVEIFEDNKYIFTMLNSPGLFINNRVDEVAWGEMKARMEEIYDLARLNGIKFGVIVYPYSSQIELDDAERKPQQDLLAFWSKHGVSMLELSSYYEAADSEMFADGTLHLSAYGHRVVAKAIRAYLAEADLLPAAGNEP